MKPKRIFKNEDFVVNDFIDFYKDSFKCDQITKLETSPKGALVIITAKYGEVAPGQVKEILVRENDKMGPKKLIREEKVV